ncbi:AraC family transcriptional regulator [Actinomycetospora lutea]|uniref:helix-turn-helix transcriptional regulator n=1 Tax=Actinomycetospora lutea TaxID=663604 RepID=UPI002366DF11|nr:AraC family transcriptional regulator [Actinomycetospora lutea]MDD7939198.1 AraC family transcriptional regulator [Actinomycetospora lutea]
MTDELIVPDQLPTWVPGDLTVCSPDDSWRGVSVRGYRYEDSDVEVPAMRDFMVVAYRRGVTDMRRRIDSTWHHEQLRPGDVSLLTRAAESHWTWDTPIEVVHVYLTHEQLAATCREMYDREVEDVELHDTIKADDPAIHRTAMTIAQEAAQGGVGSELLVDALTTQLSVTILRRHANILFRSPDAPECLNFRQEHLVRDYIQTHLHQRLTLDDLAASVGLSKFHFARQFRGSTGTTPHEFVLRRRLDRARLLLQRTSTPLPEIARTCGFADQSHMNRVVKKRLGATPGTIRAQR